MPIIDPRTAGNRRPSVKPDHCFAVGFPVCSTAFIVSSTCHVFFRNTPSTTRCHEFLSAMANKTVRRMAILSSIGTYGSVRRVLKASYPRRM